MKIIKQSHEILGECPMDYAGTIARLEAAGRTCYHSEHLICNGSAEEFVDKICKRGHLSVVEQSNFIVRTRFSCKYPLELKQIYVGNIDSNYITCVVKNDYIYMGGSCRAWMERFNIKHIRELYENWNEYIESIGDFIKIQNDNVNEIPRELIRVSVTFKTDRAVLAEFTRHRRDIAFSVESQRYCAYAKHLLLIIPHHYLEKYDDFVNDTLEPMSNEQMWVEGMRKIESLYKFLLSKCDVEDEVFGKPNNGHFYKEKAEQARSVLPNSTAVDMFVTATLTEWDHIFALRQENKTAYKQFRILLDPVKREFIDNGWY